MEGMGLRMKIFNIYGGSLKNPVLWRGFMKNQYIEGLS